MWLTVRESSAWLADSKSGTSEWKVVVKQNSWQLEKDNNAREEDVRLNRSPGYSSRIYPK